MILKRINVEVEECDEARIAELMREGFIALGDYSGPSIKEADDLDSMTVTQLRDYAKNLGLNVPKVLKKAEIIEMLEDINNGGTDDAAAGEDTPEGDDSAAGGDESE